MSDGNGLPNKSDTRARMAGLSVLDRTLAEQRHERTQRPPEPPPSRSMRVEAGLAALEEAEREREGLRSALAQAEADLRGVRVELDVLQLSLSQLQTQAVRHQNERDDAVTRLAAVEAVYDAVLTIMQRHRAVTPEDYGASQEEETRNAL